MVGNSGIATARLGSVTAMARIVPLSMKGLAIAIDTIVTCTSPVESAAMISASPRYDTAWISRPAAYLNSSIAKLNGVPIPVDP